MKLLDKVLRRIYIYFLKPIAHFYFKKFPKEIPRIYSVYLQETRKRDLEILVELTMKGPFSYLGELNEKIHLPLDGTIFQEVVQASSWQKEEIDYVISKLKNDTVYSIIDVGANVGLFSRQLLESCKKQGLAIKKIICVEPDKKNFECLKHNLQKYSETLSCVLYNIALSSTNEIKPLFRDMSNSGNYSLLPQAMHQLYPYSQEMVEVRDAHDFFNVDEEAQIIYKSDTQGADVEIVGRLPRKLWDQVHIAVIELWALPAVNNHCISNFIQRMSSFKELMFSSGRHVSLEEIEIFLKSCNYRHIDLYAAREG
jgi:FkbM family methyltransferase